MKRRPKRKVKRAGPAWLAPLPRTGVKGQGSKVALKPAQAAKESKKRPSRVDLSPAQAAAIIKRNGGEPPGAGVEGLTMARLRKTKDHLFASMQRETRRLEQPIIKRNGGESPRAPNEGLNVAQIQRAKVLLKQQPELELIVLPEESVVKLEEWEAYIGETKVKIDQPINTSWLDKTIEPPKAADFSWLDMPSEDSDIEKVAQEADAKIRVQAAAKLEQDETRFTSMVKRITGESRIWACDGKYVAFRRKKSNPDTLRRHNAFLKLGHYQHITTQDEVEIYELMDGSPFKRVQLALGELSLLDIRRQAVLAACQQDWKLFVDILAEIASRIKSMHYGEKTATEGFAKLMYEAHITHIFSMVQMRRGPTPQAIDAGVRSVRSARGEGANRLLLLPPGVKVGTDHVAEKEDAE